MTTRTIRTVDDKTSTETIREIFAAGRPVEYRGYVVSLPNGLNAKAENFSQCRFERVTDGQTFECGVWHDFREVIDMEHEYAQRRPLMDFEVEY